MVQSLIAFVRFILPFCNLLLLFTLSPKLVAEMEKCTWMAEKSHKNQKRGVHANNSIILPNAWCNRVVLLWLSPQRLLYRCKWKPIDPLKIVISFQQVLLYVCFYTRHRYQTCWDLHWEGSKWCFTQYIGRTQRKR